MPEKNDADQRDDDAFFNQLLPQRGDGALDQIAAIISRHNPHPLGQGGFDLLNFLFDAVDDGERVRAVAHHDDAADHFAASVELRDATPEVAAEVYVGNVLQVNGRSVLNFQDNVLDVLDFLDVATPADEIFGCGDFENATADVGVAHLDGAHDIAQRNAVGDKRVWIEIHLVLSYEAADRRDFGHAFYRRERVTEVPILNRTQLGEIMFPGVVNERVFVNPPYTRGVGADDRIYALGQPAANGVEIFNHARTRPINIRAVLENDVNERFAEHRFAAHELHFRRGNEDRGNGICDLVFHQVGRAAFPFR